MLYLDALGSGLSVRGEHLIVKTPDSSTSSLEMGFLPHGHRLQCVILAARGFVTTDALTWLAREHVAVLIVHEGEFLTVISAKAGRLARAELALRQRQMACILDPKRRLVAARDLVAVMPIIRSNSATSQRQHAAASVVLTNSSIHFPTPNWHEPLKPIVNQHFRNETIELDGKNFVDCTFEKVKFLYNGTMPAQFIGCNRQNEGEYTLHTDNPVVFITREMVNWLRVTGGAPPGTIIRNLINKDSR